MEERVYKNQLIDWEGEGIYVYFSNATLIWQIRWKKISTIEQVTNSLKGGMTIAYVRESNLEDFIPE